MLMRKLGLKTKGLDANAADKSLEEERKTYTRDGEKRPGFTSSVVPTLEEKLVLERQQCHLNGNGQHVQAQNGDVKSSPRSGTPSEARADGELFGAPAHGDTSRDEKVPGPSAEAGDADEEEEKAPEARSTIRKH